MSQKEKTYEEVTDAKDMVKSLCEKYPNELWAVRPDTVIVLGINNKERPEKNTKLAACNPIKGVNRALMMLHNIGVRYVIEVYWSDWNKWTNKQKLALLFHELMHIDNEVGKTVRHDLEDFRMMIDKLGVDWFDNKDLPNLLDTKVDFNLAMRPNVPEDGKLEVDTGDEITE